MNEIHTDQYIVKSIKKQKQWNEVFTNGAQSAIEKRIDAVKLMSQFGGDREEAQRVFLNLAAHYSWVPEQIERIWAQSVLYEADVEKRAAMIKEALAGIVPEFVDTSFVRDIVWLWKGRLPLGKFCLIDGDPASGKSQICLNFAVATMFGKPFFDGSLPLQTGAVIYLSAEDDTVDTITPRLIAAGAPLNTKIPIVVVPATNEDGTQFSLTNPGDISRLEMMIHHFDAKLLLIDPLNAYLGEKTDSYNDQKIRQALAPLSSLANRSGCCAAAIRHLGKAGAGQKALNRGLGSIGYSAAARVNYFVAEHPEKPGVFVFACSKISIAAFPPSLEYSIATTSVEGLQEKFPYIVGGGICDLTANQLSAAEAASAKEATKVDKVEDAKNFLLLMLAHGPMSSSELKRLAASEGIKPRTLERAKQELRIQTTKPGKTWVCELPPEQKEEAQRRLL